jgi:diketogulonate reductase-like aldo/keto reductase
VIRLYLTGGVGIDTAWDYHDQPTVATALHASGKARGDYFVTTKVPAGIGASAGNTTDCSADPLISYNYVRDNLRQLKADYVDLVLLHAPCVFARPAVPDAAASDNALWKGLERALKEGLTRAIGVSNYNSSQLATLNGVVPAVNQCEMGVVRANTTLPTKPVAHDDATIDYCKAHGITYEAWRVVGGCPMGDPRVVKISQAHSKTAAQVCLRWVLQRGATIAAGTGSDAAKAAEYAKENLGVFDWTLSASEMDELTNISPSPA